MKKLYILLCFVVLAGEVNASHIAGGELRYEYTGVGNVYRIFLSTYEECVLSQGFYFNEAISFSSVSLGVSQLRYIVQSPLPAAREDTVREIWCSSIIPDCQAPNPYYIIKRYTDTITLLPAADWKISWTDGSRNNAIINLQTPNSRNILLEVVLNNSTSPNSSPIIAGNPIFFSGINTIAPEPLQALDIDGDSLVGTMYQPLDYNNIVIPYATGYSLTQPFGPGSFTQLDLTNRLLKTYSTNTGKFAIAARISEYKNGVLVGSSCRDWMHTVINATNPKAPLPAAGSKFTYTTCPGQPNYYSYTFIDSVAADSVYLKLTPPNNGINYTITSTAGIGSATATISWTTPLNWNSSTNPYFFIKAYAHDNKCPLQGYAAYNILVKTVNTCNSDTVWAGDANADHYVNMYDPLAVAVAYGTNGLLRQNASLAWTPQWCTDWAGSAGTGVNFKHADCDGNGVVNMADLTAIYANYGLVHLKQHQQYTKGTGLPDITFIHSPGYAFPGGWIYAPLMVGTVTQSLSNVYGIAARIRIEGITPDSLNMAYWGTWLGNAANTLEFRKDLSSQAFEWVYAKTDHAAVTDHGEIAALNFTIPPGTPYGTQIILTLEDVKVIDAVGKEISGYNVLSDTITVNPLAVGNVLSVVSNAIVIPNPSGEKAVLRYSLARAVNTEISVTDMLGHLLWKGGTAEGRAGGQEVLLPKAIPQGLYTVTLRAGNEQYVLKWVRY